MSVVLGIFLYDTKYVGWEIFGIVLLGKFVYLYINKYNIF